MRSHAAHVRRTTDRTHHRGRAIAAHASRTAVSRLLRTAGFSLVEVLIATALTVVGTVALAQLSALAIRANHNARTDTLAAMLASQKLEQLRSLVWATDAAGAPISDTASNTSVVPERSSGGPGLSSSPPDALEVDAPGYCDLLDEDGRSLGDCRAPPPTPAFIRRWSIAPLPSPEEDTLAIEVSVIAWGSPRNASGSHARAVAETRMFAMKTRKGA
jgi:type II secretory pathway pseudopilin PulG